MQFLPVKHGKTLEKPKGGPLFLHYKQDKLIYKKRIREEQFAETVIFMKHYFKTLSQHFWKTRKSKFERNMQ